MKYVLVLITLALASLSAACDTSTTASAGSGAEEERKVTASPAKDPQLVVGDTATTAENGTTLTVLSYESPSTVKGAEPERGFEISAIEVKGCAGPD